MDADLPAEPSPPGAATARRGLRRGAAVGLLVGLVAGIAIGGVLGSLATESSLRPYIAVAQSQLARCQETVQHETNLVSDLLEVVGSLNAGMDATAAVAKATADSRLIEADGCASR
ncbi:hypothetical protein [Naasia lichenicola]|uniref:Uncharacterized protein n=1 Tax=Naasia lichenicola TaxID=2565933 RepID=A0A4S4FL56_9MICO|nr:hypothetical protein [Naasia lichenicola]THG30784.1 hypothetical protein E6C64_09095 [Naasia lichenicola]THG32021.1 hypothetical protein E6C64_08240 [Naasia lichenicola]